MGKVTKKILDKVQDAIVGKDKTKSVEDALKREAEGRFTHAARPDRHSEAILATCPHAASRPAAEWSHRHTEIYGAVITFLLVLTLAVPEVAAVLAFVVAGAMVGAGVVLYAREGRP